MGGKFLVGNSSFMGYFFCILVVLAVTCQSSEALERFCWKEIIEDTLPGLSLVISFVEGNDPMFFISPLSTCV